jgi:hypothetical protein
MRARTWRNLICQDLFGAIALTGKQYSAKLQPSPETLEKLREKLGDIETAFRAATGYRFDALTQSEARYLAGFSPVDALRTRITEEGNAARQRVAEKGTGQPQALARAPLPDTITADGNEQPTTNNNGEFDFSDLDIRLARGAQGDIFSPIISVLSLPCMAKRLTTPSPVNVLPVPVPLVNSMP